MKELKTWKDIIQAMLDGERVEYLGTMSEKWHELTQLPGPKVTDLLNTVRTSYRIKPRTIRIGGMEVPEPVRDVSELERGEEYYLPHLNRARLYDLYIWGGDDIDLRLLKRGMIHKTKEAALLHAKALVKISGGNYEP